MNPLKVITILGFTVVGILALWLLGAFYVGGQAGSLVFDSKVSWSSIPEYLNYKQDFVRQRDGKNNLNIQILSFENPNSSEYILYLHGNAGRLINFIPELTKKANVVSPAYPGYHASEGSPNVENVYQTAETAYDWLVAKGIPENKITILGHSMGGSPAVYLAGLKPNASKLIIINTFSSVQSMCTAQYSVLCAFTGNIFNSAKNADKVTIPVRQFGYEFDTTVSFSEGEKLFTSFTNSKDKQFFKLTGFTHSYPDFAQILPQL